MGRLSLAIDLCGDKVEAAKCSRRGDQSITGKADYRLARPTVVEADEHGCIRAPQQGAGEVPRWLYAVRSRSMEPAPDVAIKRAAANAARIMKTAVMLRKIVDARTVPLWSKQLANSMALYPFKRT